MTGLIPLLLAAAIHPTVYMTPRDVERAKENARSFAWAKATADSIIRTADEWLKRDDGWLRRAVPKGGAAFAYGSTGCPICSAGWGTWGGARASFDDPGHVVCANGHRLPDRDHPDPGTGYVGPDKRIHYFVGSYNAWVVETLTFQAIESLTYAYTLTGDERYADKAAVIFDALAAVYPECDKGSWDYPSNPPSGRFNRPWYQVARVLVHYVDYYDQLWKSAALEKASVKAGMTRRRNIEEDLLKNAAAYCYEQSQHGSLNNGEADYIRGALAVGAVLDMPEYVKWAVDGPFGIYSLLENNIDRDGGYFETSTLYANHTRELYLSFAEPLFNYRGIDLYRNVKLQRFFELHNVKQFCAGHMPRYGDTSPDTAKAEPPARPFDRDDFDALEFLRARSTDPARQKELAGIERWLAGDRLGEFLGTTNPHQDPMGGGFAGKKWLLFHARPLEEVPASLPAHLERRVMSCDFMGQKGLAFLRAGKGAASQALVLRYGPSLNHGHLDDLNINYFARGYELTYDLGYGNGATHTQVGWARQTASHNVVTVNETPQLKAGESGGSLHLFADLPGAKVVEASSEGSYASEHVSLYRRTLALIGGEYLVDIFRVRGGKEHDYGFHAPADNAELSGVALGAEGRGSLAGAEFDWGERQLNDGYLSGVEQKPYWVAPPGNGYGFLAHPRSGMTDGAWWADWRIDPDTRVRLHMPASAHTEVLTAVAPGILPRMPKARYVLARRRGTDLASEFVAVIEPYGAASNIAAVERVAVSGPAGAVPAVAVKVSRKDGAEDWVFSAGDAVVRTAGEVKFAGRFAHARVEKGRVTALDLAGVKEFAGFGVEVRPPADAWAGSVRAVDTAANVVTTTAKVPSDGSLDDAVVIFSNPRYSRTTAYRIEKVEDTGSVRRIHLAGTVTLGRGQVAGTPDAHTIATMVPHEYAKSVGRGDSGFFRGKRLRAASGASAVITAMQSGRDLAISVDTSAGFKAGDVFTYEDVQAGDRFEIPALVSKEYGLIRPNGSGPRTADSRGNR